MPEDINGTPGRDRDENALIGGDDIDRIRGLEGNDLLIGGAGNDKLWGGADSDEIHGGEGNDLVYGSYGHLDSRELPATRQTDVAVFPGKHTDYILSAHEYRRAAGDMSVLVVVQAREDSEYAVQGRDQLFDIDVLRFDEGNDRAYFLVRDPSEDRLPVDYCGTDARDIIHGSIRNDTLDSGGGAGNRLFGNEGRDHLISRDGNGNVRDYLLGGAGDDRLVGNGGRDVLQGGADNDLLNGGAGDDIIYGHSEQSAPADQADQDIAVYAGSRDEYRVTAVNVGDMPFSAEHYAGATMTGFIVQGLGDRADEGTDELIDIDLLRFDGDGSSLDLSTTPPTLVSADGQRTTDTASQTGGHGSAVIHGFGDIDWLHGGASNDTLASGVFADYL